ncbi:MAG: hypothetical protein ACI9U5_001733 [Colwellia sp.]|jgi:hypothetical protein
MTIAISKKTVSLSINHLNNTLVFVRIDHIIAILDSAVSALKR